jgi:hypothetical protein
MPAGVESRNATATGRLASFTVAAIFCSSPVQFCGVLIGVLLGFPVILQHTTGPNSFRNAPETWKSLIFSGFSQLNREKTHFSLVF